MKEQILQIVLQNLENKEDIVKIRLVENSKANVAKILKKIGNQTYQVKKIRIKDRRVLDVIGVKKLNRKVFSFLTPEGNFELDLRKSKNQLLSRIMKVFTIKNESFLLKEKVKNFKGLIGVVINSELFIKEDPKIDNLYMNVIVWKGLKQRISIQGILIKDHYNNINVELISGLGVRLEPNRKYLVFNNKLSKFEFLVNDKLTKNLSLTWEYLFGYLK